MNHTPTRYPVTALLTVLLGACGAEKPVGTNPLPSGDGSQPSAASPATMAANNALKKSLPLDDQQDFADARRGFIATLEPLDIRSADGSPVWSGESYRWQNDAAAPDSVNPSLWRQAQLNNIHGLFKVKAGIYQVRGFDLANMTLIEGDTGWIIIDPLTAVETAAAALKLANDELGARPVSAVLYTHSHIDHFAGAAAVVSAADAATGKVMVIAPKHFVEESVSENVVAGRVMGRRASYMYGMSLPRDATGHVGTGLGKQPARGTTSLIKPNTIIDHTGQTLVVDGVTMEFQYVPESEAPAEFAVYLPEHRVFCAAELMSHGFHNIYTPRGAKVRDALKWAGYIDEALMRYGARSDVLLYVHNWPTFGADTVPSFMKKQRDLYKFTHDQTLRLASRGLTPNEIAATIRLPEVLANNFATRGYYGTLKHNAKGVYQHYFGWYDGNPVNLDPLPPEESSARYVAAMGGAEAVIDKAKQAFSAGDFQWAARLGHHVVFADPTNNDARIILAQAFDQLGYMSESGPWRDIYLSGAYELRNGPSGFDIRKGANALLQSVPPKLFMIAMATAIDPDKAAGKTITVNLQFTDTGEHFSLLLDNSVLNHRPTLADNADASLSMKRELFLKLIAGQAGFGDIIGEDGVGVDGSLIKLGQLFASMGLPDFGPFPIVTP